MPSRVWWHMEWSVFPSESVVLVVIPVQVDQREFLIQCAAPSHLLTSFLFFLRCSLSVCIILHVQCLVILNRLSAGLS